MDDDTSSFDRDRVARARELAADTRTLVLAHSYQLPEIQEAASFTGDSLELSRKAKESSERRIVFCGVRFMAETAFILAPDRSVVLPVPDAGCFMADMVTPDDIDALRAKHPGLPVVAYVNSTAAVKARVDICCTSANAGRVAASLPGQALVMVPDRNLARWCAKTTGKRVETNEGFCPVHVRFTASDIERARASRPDAVLLVHPECEPGVQDLADAVLSTGQMLAFVRGDPRRSFLIATEAGVIWRMRKENPGKEFLSPGAAKNCVNMKKTRIDDLIAALEGRGGEEIALPADIVELARKPIERMLDS